MYMEKKVKSITEIPMRFLSCIFQKYPFNIHNIERHYQPHYKNDFLMVYRLCQTIRQYLLFMYIKYGTSPIEIFYAK